MNTKKKRCLTAAPAARIRRLDSLIKAAMLALFALLVSPLALAANGRDFAGFYQYANVGEMGTQEQVTLSVRVFNYSGADIADARLILQDPLLRATYGGFIRVSIQNGGSAPVSGNFTIPIAEYERWQVGSVPHLWIEFTDAAGNSVRRPVELVPGRTGERP